MEGTVGKGGSVVLHVRRHVGGLDERSERVDRVVAGEEGEVLLGTERGGTRVSAGGGHGSGMRRRRECQGWVGGRVGGDSSAAA